MGKRYSFGDGYVLDTNLCKLFQHGQQVRLGATPFKLLVCLIEHRAYTIHRDILIAGVWVNAALVSKRSMSA